MQVTFVRHAESHFNANPSSTTRDCGLTEEGKRQAQEIKVADTEFDFIITSPMRRCRETLEYSSLMEHSKKPEPIVLPLVREHKVSACDFFEGEDVDDVESEAAVLERCEDFKRYLISRASPETLPTASVPKDAAVCLPSKDVTNAVHRAHEKLGRNNPRTVVTELSNTQDEERKVVIDVRETHVCVVTHSDFVWYFTSEIHEESGERFGVWLDNAETRTFRVHSQEMDVSQE